MLPSLFNCQEKGPFAIMFLRALSGCDCEGPAPLWSEGSLRPWGPCGMYEKYLLSLRGPVRSGPLRALICFGCGGTGPSLVARAQALCRNESHASSWSVCVRLGLLVDGPCLRFSGQGTLSIVGAMALTWSFGKKTQYGSWYGGSKPRLRL